MAKQQQIVQHHLSSLSDQDKAKFSAMSSQEKHQYLAQRNLLITNPIGQQMIISMTDQQRELFQTMDQAQKVNFIQNLKQKREMEIRQQQQMQMQQQAAAGGNGPPQQFPQQVKFWFYSFFFLKTKQIFFGTTYVSD